MDIQTHDWMTICIFAEELPDSRWGHSLCASDEKLLLLGGMNLNTYCESVVFDIVIDDEKIKEHIMEKNEATMKAPKIVKSKFEAKDGDEEEELEMGPVSKILDHCYGKISKEVSNSLRGCGTPTTS